MLKFDDQGTREREAIQNARVGLAGVLYMLLAKDCDTHASQ